MRQGHAHSHQAWGFAWDTHITWKSGTQLQWGGTQHPGRGELGHFSSCLTGSRCLAVAGDYGESRARSESGPVVGGAGLANQAQPDKLVLWATSSGPSSDLGISRRMRVDATLHAKVHHPVEASGHLFCF